MATSLNLRGVKGAELTHAELDANFTNLRDTADAAAASDYQNPTNDAQGRLSTYQSGGLTYTLTYDAQGRISTISNGTTTQTMTYNPDGSVASFI